MTIRRTMLTMITGAGTAAALVLTAPAAAAAPAAQSAPPTGTSSLAALLAVDGSGFDRNWYDFDILDNAVGAVLAAKPSSPVAVLADGTVPLTAFLPNDRAFQVLAFQLTRKWYSNEADVLGAVAGKLGIDTVESVLLYHVVPGATIDSVAALKSNGAVLSTALAGQTIKVNVLSARFKLVRLIDGNRKALDPFLVASKLDLNKGNVQIAHGISLVLQPAG
jgi:uncharacterized surface protein with fasciclin (FAS1) repeats